ncbi:hypothetical protein QY886_05540 [Latilactobacillus sakei]
MSNQLFEQIQQLHLAPLLNWGAFGIEKEGHRVTAGWTIKSAKSSGEFGFS